MKHVFQSVQSWWFATLTPTRAPLTTLAQRENMRKRRLFSLMLCIVLLVCLVYILCAGVFTSIAHQTLFYALEVTFILLALWFNRQDHLPIACVTFYVCYGASTLLAEQAPSLADPHLLLWTCFLMTTFLVSLGFFARAWIIFLSAVLENLLFFWYLLFFNRDLTSLLFSHTQLPHALFYLSLLIYMSAILGIFYAAMTKRAVIQADRAIMLEQAHQANLEAYATLEAANTTAQEQALIDGLTGLPNHSAIIKQMEAELLLCQATQRDCVIIFVDVDRFKSINDTWGHAAGDTVLHTVGQRLRGGLRKNDYIGRYGGEEFAILLSNIGQSQAFELAERLRLAIAEAPCLWQRDETQPVTPIPLTASFGLAAFPLDGLTARELLNTADAAMYTAKHTGRNRVCLPDEVDAALLTEGMNTQPPQYTDQSTLQTISAMATFHDQDTQEHANRMI